LYGRSHSFAIRNIMRLGRARCLGFRANASITPRDDNDPGHHPPTSTPNLPAIQAPQEWLNTGDHRTSHEREHLVLPGMRRLPGRPRSEELLRHEAEIPCIVEAASRGGADLEHIGSQACGSASLTGPSLAQVGADGDINLRNPAAQRGSAGPGGVGRIRGSRSREGSARFPLSSPWKGVEHGQAIRRGRRFRQLVV